MATSSGSSNSSPTDFAFEAPALPAESAYDSNYKSDQPKPPSFTGYGFSQKPFTYQSQPYPPAQLFGYSSASSFSSTSGSVTGCSFSSSDALPAISRDFVRPSPKETRRPATANGALQSGKQTLGLMPGGDAERFRRMIQRNAVVEEGKPQPVGETIDEAGEGVFINPNPFSPNDKAEHPSPHPSQSDVDPHHVPTYRRASESQSGRVKQQPTWSTAVGGERLESPAHSYSFSSTQPPVSSFNPIQQNVTQIQSTYDGRPQTSDGLPSYTGFGSSVSLPSARTIVNQIDYTSPSYATAPSRAFAQDDGKILQPFSFAPFRDVRAASLGEIQPAQQGAFATNRAFSMDSGKQAQAAYEAFDSPDATSEHSPELTFVPLGGPAAKKRPRRRFDEIERLYSCGWNGCDKSYGTLNHLNAHVAMQKHGEKRLPAEFKDMRKAWRKKKREQTAATANGHYTPTTTSGWVQRGSTNSSPPDESILGRRNSTMSTSARSSVSYAPGYGWTPMMDPNASSRPTTSSSMTSSYDARPSFPASSQYAPHGMDHTVPLIGRRPSAPAYLPMPMPPPGFRQAEEDHPTPTQQNPFPATERQGSYPFQTLTSTMPMSMPTGAQQYGQFAFQR